METEKRWSDLYCQEDVKGEEIIEVLKSYVENGFPMVSELVIGLIGKAHPEVTSEELMKIIAIAKTGAARCLAKAGAPEQSKEISDIIIDNAVALTLGGLTEGGLAERSKKGSYLFANIPYIQSGATEYEKLALEIKHRLSN